LQTKRRLAAAAAALTVVFAGISSGSPGAYAQVVAPIDCPVGMDTDDIERGMTGTGWSVVAGLDPVPFDAEILGILQDGVAPGRHLIVAELSSPAITEAGGAWQGMSGSPVYIDDELAGAVSFSLSSGSSSVVGLTPAEDLFRLLAYPEAAPTRARPARIGDGMERRIESSTDAEVSSTDRFRRMHLPLSVSGLSGRGMRRLQRVLEREKAPYLAYPGASSIRPASTPVTTVGAGDSFAAAFSYGDVTTAAIGTTSLVCAGDAVAFGHFLEWRGNTFMGANAARTLAIVKDTETGPYKLAKVRGLAGTVDQDRLAGVRAHLDEAPDPITVRVDATNPDLGNSQIGRSFPLLDEVTPPVAFFTLLGNLDSVFDQISGGSSSVSFTLQGVKENGAPFDVQRDNAYSTNEDISIASSHELERYLWTLVSQPFQDVDLTKASVETEVRENRDDLRITNLTISKNGGPFRDISSLRVANGDVLSLRIFLRATGGPDQVVETTLKVPGRARHDGFLSVGRLSGSSQDQLSCFFQGTICKVRLPQRVDSFADVIEFLETLPKNNVLTAHMQLGGSHSVDKQITLDKPLTGRSEFVSLNLQN
jgi:hypothetical protein